MATPTLTTTFFLQPWSGWTQLALAGMAPVQRTVTGNAKRLARPTRAATGRKRR